MPDRCISRLARYGTECLEPESSLYWSGTARLRERLLMEICALDRQRDKLEQIDGKMDFSLQQTCREMIHSREILYRQLGR